MGLFLTQTQIFNWSAGICYEIFNSTKSYWSHRLDLVHHVLNHDLEIDIYLDTLSLIHQFSLCLLLLQVIHLLASFFSVLLETFDFIKTRSFLSSVVRRLRRWQVAQQIISAILQSRVIYISHYLHLLKTFMVNVKVR